MLKFATVSVFAGLLFAVLDTIININPYAQKLLSVFKPIARTSVNAPLGMLIDLAYGFLLAFIFLLLYKALPGETGLLKGLSYGVIIWFFRVVMYSASQYVMFNIPASVVFYNLAAGLLEMLILGLFIGLTLKPLN